MEEKNGVLAAEEKQKLLSLSEISLILDSYEDIFSDFDPRPNSQRALSEDFLAEAKRASRDKVSGEIELKLLIPKDKRGQQQENEIKKRLREHFKKHCISLEKDYRSFIRKGFTFAAAGIFVMFIASFILFEFTEKSLLLSFIIIVLEPAGWFLFWEGLGQALFESKKMRPDIDFYRKMSKCSVRFLDY